MTKIEWVKNSDGTQGKTWNPLRGCTRVSPGCGGPGPHGGCYAEGIAARFSGPGQPYEGIAEMRGGKPRWTGKLAFVEHLLMLPLRTRKPTTWFVNSMSDLFHEKVEDGWIDHIFAVMALCPQHTFQVLTKRADRMRAYMTDPATRDRVDAAMNDIAPAHWCTREVEDFGGWPLKAVWLGVSVEDQRRADERIPDLLATPAAVRWISAEPLLGPVDLMTINRPAPLGSMSALRCEEGQRAWLDWVVTGGESGPGARPSHPQWFRDIRDQCHASRTAYLHKQNGAWVDTEGWYADHPVSLPIRRWTGTEWTDRSDPNEVAPEWVALVGKKAAGRLLDGVTHNGFPESGRVGAEGSRRG